MTNHGPRFICPECEGGFDEPVDVTGKSLRLGGGFVRYDAKGCPWCGHAMKATRTARPEEQHD